MSEYLLLADLTDEFIDDFMGGGHNVTHSVFLTARAFFSEDTEPMMAPLGEAAITLLD